MPFAALDDEFFGHAKTVTAGLAGCGLYARSLSYCAHYLTDGFVPKAWASEISSVNVRRKVTTSGLWVEVTGGEAYEYVVEGAAYTVTVPGPGFFIPDYITYNPTRQAVELKRSELSKKRSEAGKKGALVRWQRNSNPNGNRDSKSSFCHDENMASAKQPDGPLPLPLKNSPKAVPVARPDTPAKPGERPTDHTLKNITPTLREIA